LAEWVALAVLAVWGAQAVSVALAAQVVLAGLEGPVVPSPRGLAARGLTTRRIEGGRPTATSGPPTSSVGRPGVRGSEEPGPATGLPAAGRDKAAPARATGPRAVVRDNVVPE
jgi:hypothetical protein